MQNKSINQFIEETSSNSPTPGGGSVAALVAALSSALTSMVASLTVNKKGYEKIYNEMEVIIVKMQEKNKLFLESMDDDVQVFNKLMEGYRLPKSNEEEKKYRDTFFQEKTKEALQVPLVLARNVYTLFDDIRLCANSGNQGLASDAAIACILARSAILSAICNVEINLGAIKDDFYVDSISQEIQKLANDTLMQEKEILNLTQYLKMIK